MIFATIREDEEWRAAPGASMKPVLSVQNSEKHVGLIVEDDECISSLIVEALPETEFTVCSNLRAAEKLLFEEGRTFSVILLDLHLPDGQSLELLGSIRNDYKYSQTPIFLMTADQSESPALLALGIGANDYIYKPLKMKVLRAKILHVLKEQREGMNGRGTDPRGQILFNDYVVDFDSLSLSRKLNNSENRIPLTPTEFKILATLLKNKNQVVSRDLLQSSVWGPEVHLGERTIDQHVASLRKKLGPESREMIHTERGTGFRLLS